MTPCDVIADGKAGIIIACSRGGRARQRCCICGGTATVLCDYPLRGEKVGQTCDLPLCRKHTTRVGPNRDYCPAHARVDRPKGVSE
jgi:hypothetical protein